MTLAYLDPGSGSLIASAFVGGLAAAGVAAKQARARFSSGLGRKRKNDAEFEATTADDEVTGDEAAAPQAVTAEVEAVDGETAPKAPVGSDT